MADNQNEEQANEDAARRIQAQMWALDQAADDENDNNDNNDDDDNDNNEDEDVDADDRERARGAVDGGIAGDVKDENQIRITRSLKCPVVLYFECAEDLNTLSPSNPLLKHGQTIYVGLDKNQKLAVAIDQYIKFVNSKLPKKKKKGLGNNLNTEHIKLADLDFMHVNLLDAENTVEASAMMKNDRISVYKERSKQRSVRNEIVRLQRESDRKYFKDLRQLLPNPSPEGMGCDVVLDCRGKISDERGFSQNVLATTVRANSVLISKRCKWLGRKINDAREDNRRRAEMTVQDDGEGANIAPSLKMAQSEDDEEEEIIMAEDPSALAARDEAPAPQLPEAGEEGSPFVAKVEDDDEEWEKRASETIKKKKKTPSLKTDTSNQITSTSPNSVWVSLNHSPQAVKLLLEYCYTNRVQSLGQEAFVKASKYLNAKDVGQLVAKQSGPVMPFRKHEWPEGGHPTVSLHLALAGITLAEEAHMPRLSLMCELAAAQLVDVRNVVDILSACQIQQSKTGNRLALLRKAAMLDCIMGSGQGGVEALFINASFRAGLAEKKDIVIPSLLDGSIEVMPTKVTKEIKRKKDRQSSDWKKHFELNDNADKNKRIMERIKWRESKTVQRRMEVAFGPSGSSLRMPPSPPAQNIWRDSYHRDPPPLNQNRGSKRKSSDSRSSDSGRNVRRRSSSRRQNRGG